jgi:hypothetical protein
MKAFRLMNVRGFADTGWIDLKPLTLLVGPNNTGKSSLLRFLPLLRQSAGAPTRGPLLWNKEGGLDFGAYEDVRRRRADGPMVVSMRQAVDSPHGIWPNTGRSGGLYELEVRLSAGNGGQPCGLRLVQDDQDDRAYDVDLDGMGATTPRAGCVAAPPFELRFESGPVPTVLPERAGLFNEAFHADLRAAATRVGLTLDSGDGALPVAVLARLLAEGPGEPPPGAEPGAWREFQGRVWALSVPEQLQSLDWSLRGWARRVAYLGPARENPQRFYRLWEDPGTRLDPTGSNLPRVLKALSAAELEALNQLLLLRLGFAVEVEGAGANVQVQLVDAAGERFNIVDLGFGFSQVLPIYVQSFLGRAGGPDARNRPSAVAIEQPELHLHPRHQAQLADLFGALIAEEAGLSAPFLVETHSEALIDRLGELIAEGTVRREAVQVLLFEKKGGDCVMRATEYDEEGILRDWPPGFLSR